MDIFCEHIVKRKKQMVDYILEVVLIFVAVYMSFIVLGVGIFREFFLLIIAGIWYGVVYLIRRKSIEYEYTLTNNELDIDRIFAQKSRKRVTSIDLARIDYIRPIEDADREKNPNLVDHYLCECKESDNTYVLVFARDGKVHRIFFTPSNKMKLKMKEVNPSRITVVVEEEEEE